MLNKSYFIEKVDRLNMVTSKKGDFNIFSKANLETGLKGVLLR
jgi:hypothetical protein